MDGEKINLPRLRRFNQQQSTQLEQQARQEIIEPTSPKNHRSSRMRKLLRNSSEKKHHHHYPGSTPLNDNFELDNPSTQKNFEYSFDKGKQECQARLIPPKISKRPRKWQRLLQKKPSNKLYQLPVEDFNSDAIDALVMEKGTMVFSSEGDDKKKTREEREEEERIRREKKEKQEELEQLEKSREIARKELESKRAEEAEKAARLEREEEERLREKQLQILRENAIIDEDLHEKVQTVDIQSKLKKSRNRK